MILGDQLGDTYRMDHRPRCLFDRSVAPSRGPVLRHYRRDPLNDYEAEYIFLLHHPLSLR